MFNSKKGQALAELGKIAMGIVAFAIIMVVGFLIVAEGQNQIVTIDGILDETNDSQKTVGYNATVTLSNAMDDIPAWVPIIVIASIGAVLIGLVAMFRKMGQ